jgi:general secretion pathway protein K
MPLRARVRCEPSSKRTALLKNSLEIALTLGDCFKVRPARLHQESLTNSWAFVVSKIKAELKAMRSKNEEGIALIAVLWTLALLSLIAASLSWETRTGARIARNVADNATARAAADAGIQRAILDLVAIPTADAKKFRVDGSAYIWRFADSTVRISVKDELGKVNLNQAPEAILAALFGAVGVDPGRAQSLADAIADFRDPDDFKRTAGAEEADYRAAGLAWGPKNAPFQGIEELQQVMGMDAMLFKRVAPYVTLYSIGNSINAAAAGERLTESLRQAGFNYFVGSTGIAYSIRAEARSSNGALFVREAVVQLTAGLTTPWILSWRQGGA